MRRRFVEVLIGVVCFVGVTPRARGQGGLGVCIGDVAEVVDDIFQTSDGRFAPQLSFGTYVRGVNGCVGRSINKVDYSYSCHAPGPGEDIGAYADSLDWQWTQHIRNCDGATVRDGSDGCYDPRYGRIYDLGGEANRVVLFPIIDHMRPGEYPFEAFEYTVWLSNDPDATEVAAPGSPDPTKWNPAVLVKAFLQGWTRNPAAQGAADASRDDLGVFLRDTSGGDAIADGLTMVWALPCGLTFRYVSIVAGNNGNPTADCTFHSSDDELDAVAGLNEDGTVLCPDADGDGHRDAACGGGDCDDTDPEVHPGAFEPCDADRDLDCRPSRACPEGTSCDGHSGLCVPVCFEGGCPEGASCVDGFCVERACAERTEPCPEGTICRGGDCVAPCDGVVCPSGQRCVQGACIDPCEGVLCPVNQVCVARDPAATTLCGPSCACADLADRLCGDGTACDTRDDSPSLGLCLPAGCESVTCGAGEVCRDGGRCVDACEGVVCPLNQRCREGVCEPDPCAGVTCFGGLVCDAGRCVDPCSLVTCGPSEVCRDGMCEPDPCAGVTCPGGGHCEAGRCVGGADDGGTDGGGGGATTPDAGASAPDAGSGGDTAGGAAGGCGCRLDPVQQVPGGALLWPILFVWLLRPRRRGRHG